MKLIGSILIIFASVIASYFYEKRLQSYITSTEELYELVLYIKNKIEYFSMPVNEILNSYSRDTGIINKLSEPDFLDKSIKGDIESFISNLGKGYKKEQVALCEYTLSVLEASKNKMKMEFTKKAKTFRSLSLFTGIGCVILLV